MNNPCILMTVANEMTSKVNDLSKDTSNNNPMTFVIERGQQCFS